MSAGFTARDGRGQYDKELMTHVLDDKYIITKKLINAESRGAKYGRRANFKKDFEPLLRQNLCYGDYSKGAPFYHPQAARHVVASDPGIEATDEVSNRMGEKIYGYQEPDKVEVAEEVGKHNAKLVGGENLGFHNHETGLYQAGHNNIKWEHGPKRDSDYDTKDGYVVSDHIRATQISNPLKSYAPEKMWIGSGHAPGSRRMLQIPFHV